LRLLALERDPTYGDGTAIAVQHDPDRSAIFICMDLRAG
jgi:hypothetical protein